MLGNLTRVSDTIYEFYRSVKDAASRLIELRNEVLSLVGFLHFLQQTTELDTQAHGTIHKFPHILKSTIGPNR